MRNALKRFGTERVHPLTEGCIQSVADHANKLGFNKPHKIDETMRRWEKYVSGIRRFFAGADGKGSQRIDALPVAPRE